MMYVFVTIAIICIKIFFDARGIHMYYNVENKHDQLSVVSLRTTQNNTHDAPSVSKRGSFNF
jgi:hypothetical protein